MKECMVLRLENCSSSKKTEIAYNFSLITLELSVTHVPIIVCLSVERLRNKIELSKEFARKEGNKREIVNTDKKWKSLEETIDCTAKERDSGGPILNSSMDN